MSDYHTGIDSISSTGLKMLLQSSPAHFVRQYTEEKKPSTKAQRFGIAAHVYLLDLARDGDYCTDRWRPCPERQCAHEVDPRRQEYGGGI